MRILFFLLFFSNILLGQNLTPVKDNNSLKWGYQDKNGQLVISSEYLEALPFDGDYAVVKKKNGYGIIDKEGKIIFHPQFKKIEHWKNGIFILFRKSGRKSLKYNFNVGLAEKKRQLNQSYFYYTTFFENELRVYNQRGELIIFPDGEIQSSKGSKEVNCYENNFFAIKKRKWGFVDSTNQMILPFEYDTILFSPNLQKSHSKIIIAQKSKIWYRINLADLSTPFQEYDGLEYLKNGKLFYKKNGKYGLIEEDGSVSKYINWEETLVNGRKQHSGGNWNLYLLHGKYGVFNDKNFQPLIQPTYQKLFPIHDSNLFIAKKEKLFGVINLENEIIIDFEYQSINQYNGLGLKAVKNNKLGVLDHSGNIIIPFEFEIDDSPNNYYSWWDSRSLPFPGEQGTLKRNGKIGIVNKKNEVIIPFEYDEIKGFNPKNKLYQVRKNKKWGIVNSNNEIIVPIEFDYFYYMNSNKIEGNWNSDNHVNKISMHNELGYHTMAGDTPPPRSNEVFIAKNNNKITAYNLKGKQLFPFQETIEKYHDSAKVFYYSKDTLILAESKNGFGVVNQKGNIWLDFIYEDIQFYAWDIFLVKKNNKFGLIHKDGIILQPIEYEEIKGQLVKKNGKHGILNKERKSFLFDLIYDEIELKNSKSVILPKINNKWGWYNKFGEEIFPIKYDTIVPFRVWSKIAKVKVNHKWGLLKAEKKNFILAPIYDEIIDFRNSLNPLVKVRKNEMWEIFNLEKNNIITKDFNEIKQDKVRKGKYWGVINSQGEIIVKVEYDSLISYFNEKVICAKKNGKWGIINQENQVIIDFKFDATKRVSDSLFYVKLNEKWGVVNDQKKLIVEIAYDKIEIIHGHGFRAMKNGKWGLLSQNGKPITPFEFERLDLKYKEKQIYVIRNGKKGVIDFEGNVVVNFEYRSIQKINEGFIVRKGEKYGMINKKQQILIPIAYDQLSKESIFIKSRQNKMEGLFDLEGNLLVECIYQRIEFRNDCPIQDCPIMVVNDNKYGFVGANGKIIIPPQFKNARPFNKKVAPVNKGNRWFLINKKGEKVSKEYDYVEIGRTYHELGKVKSGGKYGVINGKGEEVIPIRYKKIVLPRKRYRKNNNGDLREELIIANDFLGNIILFKSNGTPIIQTQRVGFRRFISGMVILIDELKQRNFEDRQGNNLIPGFEYVQHGTDRYFVVTKNGKKGFYDVIKKTYLIPLKYDQMITYWKDGWLEVSFSLKSQWTKVWLVKGKLQEEKPEIPIAYSKTLWKNYFKENKEWKYQFFNKESGVVNEVLYDYVGVFSEGLIAVEKEEKIGFIDEKGELKIPFLFETDYSTKNTFKFQEGLAHVIKNGKYGFINKKGETVIPFQYDIAFPVYDGEIVVWENQEWKVLKVKDFMKK